MQVLERSDSLELTRFGDGLSDETKIATASF